MTAIERPSDEVVVGVIRSWKDWNSIRVYRRHGNEVYYECDDTPQGTPSLYDPRDDVQSAINLFHWTCDENNLKIQTIVGYNSPNSGSDANERYWGVHSGKINRLLIPIEGIDFCYAVVNLAAKVMGISEPNVPT